MANETTNDFSNALSGLLDTAGKLVGQSDRPVEQRSQKCSRDC